MPAPHVFFLAISTLKIQRTVTFTFYQIFPSSLQNSKKLPVLMYCGKYDIFTSQIVKLCPSKVMQCREESGRLTLANESSGLALSGLQPMLICVDVVAGIILLAFVMCLSRQMRETNFLQCDTCRSKEFFFPNLIF